MLSQQQTINHSPSYMYPFTMKTLVYSHVPQKKLHFDPHYDEPTDLMLLSKSLRSISSIEIPR